MTTQEIIDYYANLLILQYSDKPRAYATIQALIATVIMNQLPVQVQGAFNLNSAVGVQLDFLGKYCGVTRTANGFGGVITLNDSDFRQLINFAIILNNKGSSLYEIQALVNLYFASDFYVFDYKNMRMSYLLSSVVGSLNLAKMIVTQNLLPRPMSVELGTLIYNPTINTFFGMRDYLKAAYNVSPFNTYTSYSMTSPWLSYSMAVA